MPNHISIIDKLQAETDCRMSSHLSFLRVYYQMTQQPSLKKALSASPLEKGSELISIHPALPQVCLARIYPAAHPTYALFLPESARHLMGNCALNSGE